MGLLNYIYKTALFIAVEQGDIELMKVLLPYTKREIMSTYVFDLNFEIIFQLFSY